MLRMDRFFDWTQLHNVLLGLACAFLCWGAAQAQEARAPLPATLVADDVRLTGDGILRARGNVEAFHRDTHLRAAAVSFDPATGALRLTGPLTLRQGDGVFITASEAELSPDLRDGLLRGARMVLGQQVQLAAAEMNRVEGRYTQLYKTAVTSCQVCADGRPPLWQIRARRVIHDAEARQLYFDGAQLRLGDVPVFYLPRLRLPDPTLERARGFLIPSFRSTTQLGTGIKLPYFMPFGAHRDLTLTPYLSSSTTTLEARYRQAYANGSLQFQGAVSRDDQRPGEERAYIFGNGRFETQRDFVLSFTLETSADDAYLKDYGYSDADRLESNLFLSRVRRDTFLRYGLINFKTLRDGEDNATLPTNLLDFQIEHRLFPRHIGGTLRLGGTAHAHYRSSDLDVDGPDPDSLIDGRDVQRVNLDAQWQRSWISNAGLVTQGQLGLAADAFAVAQDTSFADNTHRIVPRAGLALRYPMQRQTGGDARQIIEPVVQLGYVGADDLSLPNEESTRVEFDAGNLLSLSRFAQPDRREHGLSAVMGLTWAHLDPAGRSARIALGYVVRDTSDDDFSVSSGLSGTASDFLLAGQIHGIGGLSLSSRALIDDQFKLSKAEMRGAWDLTRGSVSGSYVWLTADPAEDRAEDVAEFNLLGRLDLQGGWRASSDIRYDLVQDRTAYAGLGLGYDNECVSAQFSVSRRFTASTAVEPSTSLGFTVSLRGFAVARGTQKHASTCNQSAK